LIPNQLAKVYLLGFDSFKLSTKEKKTIKMRRIKRKEKKENTFEKRGFQF